VCTALRAHLCHSLLRDLVNLLGRDLAQQIISLVIQQIGLGFLKLRL
jgi:hypothetical protein